MKPRTRLSSSAVSAVSTHGPRIRSLEAVRVAARDGQEARPAESRHRARWRGCGRHGLDNMIAASKWNAAAGLAEQATTRPALRPELTMLLKKAGFPEGLLPGADATMPSEAPSNYSPWTLESVTPVTKHTAIFKLVSSDIKRGTPHPRGRGRLPEPITWHTTLLAEVGPNEEGPLPWIERDYTPISSAKEWEQGRCDLLIKIYNRGALTSWLFHQPRPRSFFPSPRRRCMCRGWCPTGAASSPRACSSSPGTGVVALPRASPIATPRDS